MSEHDLRELLRRAVPPAPELDAAVIQRRATRERRNRTAWAAGCAAAVAVIVGSVAIPALSPDESGLLSPGSPAPAVIPWASTSPGPAPVPPGTVTAPLAGEPIELRLVVDEQARSGEPLEFIVRIANLGADPVSLDPCPYYRVQYLPHVETGYLNCAHAPDAIPPGSHLDFAMQIGVLPLGDAPADLGGTYDLLWQLGGEGAEGATVTTPVELTPAGPLPDRRCLPGGQVQKPSAAGSGFVGSRAIFSGLPDPQWRLTHAQAAELRALLRTTKRGIHRHGPQEMGDFVIRADRPASVGFLQDLGHTDAIGITPESRVGRFLAEQQWDCSGVPAPSAAD